MLSVIVMWSGISYCAGSFEVLVSDAAVSSCINCLFLTLSLSVTTGLTLNWGVLVAWSVVHGGTMTLPGITLYLSTAIWSMIYDSIYSHQVAVVIVTMVAVNPIVSYFCSSCFLPAAKCSVPLSWLFIQCFQWMTLMWHLAL